MISSLILAGMMFTPTIYILALITGKTLADMIDGDENVVD